MLISLRSIGATVLGALLGLASPVFGQISGLGMPGSFEATSMGDGVRANLTWTDTSVSETHFEIVREKASGVSWVEQSILTSPQNTTSKMDSPGSGLFRYRMRAVNAAGGSFFTSWTFCQVEMVPPVEPWDLTFTDMGDGERGRLNWTDRSNNEARFEIIRQRQNSLGVWYGDTVLIAAANTETYVNRPGVGSYRYRIRSVNTAGASAWSGWVAGVIAPLGSSGNTTAPVGPTNLVATNLGDGVRAHVSWDDNADNEDGYRVFRDKLVAGAWALDDTIELEANASSLTDAPGEGTYRYSVRAFNDIGLSPFSNPSITNVVLLAPTVPTDLEFTDLGDGLRGRVTWTDRSNNEAGFEVLRQRQNASGVWFGDTVLMGAANTQAMNNMPGPGTFRYRIRSTNAAGTSAWSGWVVGIIQDVAPAAPSGLAGADLGNQSQVQLTWTDNSHNETGFEVERQTQSGASWVGLATMSAGTNLEALTDAPGIGTHRYRVRAVNAVGPSVMTPWTVVSVNSIPPPAAPSGLSVVNINGQQARLTWTDNSNNETGFEVERQTEQTLGWGATATLSVAANTEILNDTPGPGTHRYRVRAEGQGGASAYTAWVQVEVVSPFPPAPTNVAVVNLNDGVRAQVTWSDNSTNETGFHVERQTLSGTSWGSSVTHNAPVNATQYVDAAGIGTHRFRVRAVNAAGASPYSAWAQVTIVAVAPAAPSGLTATSLNDGVRARLDWTDNSSNETGFQIERQTLAGTTWANAGAITAPANAQTYTDSPGAGTHRYRVRSVNLAGSSAYTPWAQVTVSGSAPAAPSGLQAVDAGNRRALLSWSDNSTNETRFDIERQPAFSTGVVTVSANVTGYIDNCGAGTFQYRVRSANAAGVSAWTGWVSVVIQDTLPAAPSGLTVVDLGNASQVRLNWLDNSDNETGFNIEVQKQQAGGTWGATAVLTASANATTRTDAPGVGTHRYRIAAAGTAGVSPFTSWVTVMVTNGAVPPTAVITLLNPTNRMAPSVVHVHATASSLGSPSFYWHRARFEWDFGDTVGQELTTTDPTNNNATVNLSKQQQGFNAAYIYRNPGVYTIRLRMTNESGGVHETTRQVTIAPDTRVARYVDAMTGSDSNTGLSPAAPWRTLPYATAHATSNTKILLRRGQVFPVTNGANLGDWTNVTIGSFGTGALPIVRWQGSNDGTVLHTDSDSVDVVIQDLRFEAPYDPDTSQIDAISATGRLQTVWNCEFGDFENWVEATTLSQGFLIVNPRGGASRAQQFPVIATDFVLLGARAEESRKEHIVRVMPRSSTSQPSARINVSFSDLDQNAVGGKGAMRYQAVQFGTLFRNNLLNGRTDIGHDDGDCDNIVMDGCRVSEAPGAMSLALHHNVRGFCVRNTLFAITSDSGKAIGTFQSATFSGLHGAENVDIVDTEFNISPRPGHSYVVRLVHPGFDVTNVRLLNNRFIVPSNFNEHILEVKRESDLATVQGNGYSNLGAAFDYHEVGGSPLNWNEWLGLSVTQGEVLLPP